MIVSVNTRISIIDKKKGNSLFVVHKTQFFFIKIFRRFYNFFKIIVDFSSEEEYTDNNKAIRLKTTLSPVVFLDNG